jgi:hypothetical protein
LKRTRSNSGQDCLNALRLFDTGESYRHFIAKSALFYLLRKLGHEVQTEVDVYGRNTSRPEYTFDTFRSLGVADILDLTTNVQYEIERSNIPSKWRRKAEQYRRDGWEVIIVPIHKSPSDIDGLLDFVGQYIQPD